MYCIKMHRSNEEFWKSSLIRITKMIDMFADEAELKAATYKNQSYESKYFKPEVKTVKSLKEIGGLV